MRIRKPSKYKAVRTNGYDSKAEAARAAELKLLQHKGEIRELREQPTFVVSPPGCKPIKYKPDFQYTENGREIVEDTKGVETAVFRIKAKLFRWAHPGIELRISRKVGRSFRVEVFA